MEDFKQGDQVEWLQQIGEVDFTVKGVVEIVETETLTVRDSLGQFWKVTGEDAPKKV